MYLTTPVKGGKTQILHHDTGGQPARAVTSVTDAQIAADLAADLAGIEREPDDSFWRNRLAGHLNALPAAVAAAVREELARYTPGTERTWTFFGHWDGDRLTVEFAEPGEVDDHRPADDATWPEGLWAAAASGRTQAEAQARAVAEYESALLHECSVCSGTHLAPPAGDPDGEPAPCWFCSGLPLD